MTLRENWQEAIDVAESLLVFIICGLKQRDKYKDTLAATKKLHSSAGVLNIGTGGVPRITFREAKDILRRHCGMLYADDKENFTLVYSCLHSFLVYTNPDQKGGRRSGTWPVLP